MKICVTKSTCETPADYFVHRLAMAGFDAETCRVHMPAATVLLWLNAYTERVGTPRLAKNLKPFDLDGLPLHPNSSRTYGRGLVWVGKDAPAGGRIDYSL